LFQSRNLARASVHGIEAALRQELAAVHPSLRSLSIESSVHWSHGDDDVTDRPLNTVLPLKALFALRWQATPWPLATDLRVTHYGRQNRTDFSTGPFFVPPSRTLVDLVAHWTPRPRLSCHFGLYNLGDQRFWSYPEARRYDPADPRVEIASWPGVHANFTVSLQF
jgi:hemoglobin/transferrin/lactoferrin receptor protein